MFNKIVTFRNKISQKIQQTKNCKKVQHNFYVTQTLKAEN